MTDDTQTRKDLIAGVFSRAAQIYGQVGPRFFSEFGRRLVDLAAPSEGAVVLDIATGRGAVLFPAAEKVGPGGRVIGIDLSPGMVEATTQEVRRRHISQVEVRLGDAERLEFADSTFDLVLCGFGLFFFPHLDAALAQFHRVLRPGGALAASTWGKDDERLAGLAEVTKAYGTNVKLVSHDLDTAKELDAVLRRAGFGDISIVHEDGEIVYADEEEWWAVGWGLAGRAGRERLAPDVLPRYKTDLLARFRELMGPGEIRIQTEVLYAIARKSTKRNP